MEVFTFVDLRRVVARPILRIRLPRRGRLDRNRFGCRRGSSVHCCFLRRACCNQFTSYDVLALKLPINVVRASAAGFVGIGKNVVFAIPGWLCHAFGSKPVECVTGESNT